MRSPFAPLRRQSLRLRITLTFVVAAAALAVVLATTTFFTVRSFLESQRVRSGSRQTIFGLLFAREFFRDRPADPEELVSLLQLRGDFQTMVVMPDDWFSTALSLTPAVIPAGLADLVAEERLGYQVTHVGGERSLAFGAPLPAPRTDLYLFYSLEDIDETLSVLARVLTIAGFAIVAAAGLIAQRTGGRLIRPLGDVSTAAQRVAEGLLETRVPAAGRDEVGLLAESFNRMAAALEEMIQRERRFVANVSHELRTPISALRTASELLAAHRDELRPAAREAAGLLAEDVANLQRLVEELMEVSEVDAGKAVVRWEPVDLRALTAAVVESRRRDAAIDGEAIVTVSDKARLERILSNLVDNAYEHGGGRDVRVRVAAEDGACRIEVTDRGPGIPAEDLPHLFDRFFKADRSRTRERGGIGLGLTIAAENARLLGGTLDAASEPGGGATFTLRIPRRDAAPEPGR